MSAVRAAPTEFYHNGTIHLNYAEGLVGAAQSPFDFQPEANFSRMTYELSYSTPGGLQDMDALLTSAAMKCHPGGSCSLVGPGDRAGVYLNENGSFGSPDSPSRVEVDGHQLDPKETCEDCAWKAWVWTHTPVWPMAEVTFSMKITVWP